jgi:DNA-binding NarL/FixJ family response regulator
VIRVMVSAGSALERAGVEALLAADPDIVVSETDADVVVLVGGGEIPAGAAVVVIDGEDARELLRAGARGVLPRGTSAAELSAAIRAAAAGLVAMDAASADAIAAGRAVPVGAQPLSPREIEVLRRMADGMANKNIAFELGISEHTVKFHVASILAKLNAASRAEAVAIGLRRGYILL